MNILIKKMQEHRYILEPYKQAKRKFVCPQCLHKNEFVRYVDIETNKRLGDHVGRCERQDNCGYHFTPKMFFEASPQIILSTYNHERTFAKPPPLPSYIDSNILKSSMKVYNQNMFVMFLNQAFGAVISQQLTERYLIGTSKFWNGSTVFWQVDNHNKVRGGKIIEYQIRESNNFYQCQPKRNKANKPAVQWVHSLLKIENYNLNQCLFGLHLIDSDTTKAIAIVESEKTAIIASIYFPQYLWLACGGADGLNAEKLQPLKGRKVLLFPDCNKLDKWQKKAKEFSSIATFAVSDLLELKANDTERLEGIDFADWLLKFNYIDFLDPPAEQKNDESELIAEVIGNVSAKYLPSGWHYQIINENIKTLCNEEGFPATWNKPKSKKETLALMLDKNPTLDLLIENLNCQLL